MHQFTTTSFSAAALAITLGFTPAFASEKLVIYSSTDADNLKIFADAFSAAHPDIETEWVRDSTGIMHARLMAEKDNPRADVLFAMAATSMLTMEDLDMFHAYQPAGTDKLDPRYLDNEGEMNWVGMYGWAGALCVNTIEMERLDLPMPATWADLTDPVYQGHISMPNPASSGTGYLDVASWIQLFGEDKAWDYMDALHENIAVYTHSGSKPCVQAATGEFAIGVSWPFRGAKLIEEGAPLELVVPTEGVGWEMQASAIIAGTDQLDAAKIFMDWAISEEAIKTYSTSYSVVAMPEVAVETPNFPQEVYERLIDNDFVWSANNKDEIVAEWRRRYEQKTEGS